MSKDFGIPLPFVELLGFDMVQYVGGKSEIRYAIQPAHCNSFGVGHGGAIMTLLDVALATAARSEAPGMSVVTIEIKTSFMHPARGTVTGRGQLLHRTAKMAFCEASVWDEEGRRCAHATGTFKYVPHRSQG